MGKTRGWRKKDRERFRDDALVEIRYETGGSEVWLYHERICDRIDMAGRNHTRVSLFQLAMEVHDPQGLAADPDEWVRTRVAILERLRDLGRIRFEGAVTVHSMLDVSLAPKTYRKWHGHTGTHDDQERIGGKFGPKKTPARTDVEPIDGADDGPTDNTVTVPSRSDDSVPKTTAYKTRPDQIRPEVNTANAASTPRGGGGSVAELDAAEEGDAARRCGELLDPHMTGGVEWLTDSIALRIRRVHPISKRREAPAAWVAAAGKFDERARRGGEGWPPPDPFGYYLGIVPGADVVVESKDAAGTDKATAEAARAAKLEAYIAANSETVPS